MKEIRKFIGLTFSTSWILWGLLVALTQLKILGYGTPLSMIILLLAASAPTLCAIWLKKHNSSKEEYKAFLKNIINPKQHLFWYIFIFIAVFMNSIVQLMVPDGIANVILKKPFYYAIISLPIMIVGGGFEEIGWRGFLQPSLEERFSPLLSTLSVGFIWALWHIPLWFIIGTNQTNMNFLAFLINALAFSFLLAVVFKGTKSIFMCIICHALINSFMEIYTWSNNIFGNIAILLVNVMIFTVFQHIRKKYIKNLFYL